MILKFSKRDLVLICSALVIAVMMSSFQTIPAIFEKQFLKFDQNLLTLYKGHFIKLTQLLRIPDNSVNSGTAFQIGLASTVIIILTIGTSLYKKSLFPIFFLIFIIAAIFIVTPQSAYIWEKISLLRYFLYPWRFLTLTVLASSFLAVYLVDSLRPKLALSAFILIITIFSARHFFLKPTQISQNIPTPTLTTQNEYDTIWMNQATFENPSLIRTSSKEAQIREVQNSPFKLLFQVDTKEPTSIVVRKIYFPGWTLKENGQKKYIENKDGLIALVVPKGNWMIDVYFIESGLRKIANALSLISISAFLCSFLFLSKIKKFSKIYFG